MTGLPHPEQFNRYNATLPPQRSDREVKPADTDVLAQSFQVWLQSFSAWQAWTQHVSALTIAAQREWFTFIERRLSQDAALGNELAKCKAPDDVIRAYTSFYRTAAQDYQNELAEMVRLSGTAMQPPQSIH